MSDPLNTLNKTSENVINHADVNNVKDEPTSNAAELQNAKKGSIGWKIFNITMTIMTGGLYGIAWGIFELGSYISNAKKGNRSTPLTQQKNTGDPNGMEFGKTNKKAVEQAPSFKPFSIDINSIKGADQNIEKNFNEFMKPTYDDKEGHQEIFMYENKTTFDEFKENCKELAEPLSELFDKFEKQYKNSGIDLLAKGVKAKIGNNCKETLFNYIKKVLEHEGRLGDRLFKLGGFVEVGVPKKISEFLQHIADELNAGADKYIKPKAGVHFELPKSKIDTSALKKEHQKLSNTFIGYDTKNFETAKNTYERITSNNFSRLGIAIKSTFESFVKTFGQDGVQKIVDGLGFEKEFGKLEEEETNCEVALYRALYPDEDDEPAQYYIYNDLISSSQGENGPSSQDVLDFTVNRLNMLVEKFDLKPIETAN